MTNEATNFSELLEEDLRDVFCNVEEFGETVTFYPADGSPSRRLVAVIESSQRVFDGEMIAQLAEEITVLVGRDRHGEKGGIEAPAVGDEIKRERDNQTYFYTGEVRNSDTASWWLAYSRHLPVALGTSQRRNQR